MANYNPPTEDITVFNTSLFNQPENILTQGEADLLYLSKKKSDTSTAGNTTFTGTIKVEYELDVAVGPNNAKLYPPIIIEALPLPPANIDRCMGFPVVL